MLDFLMEIIDDSTHWSKIVESVSPGNLVCQTRWIRMVFISLDLNVEGVGDDFTILLDNRLLSILLIKY